MSMTAASRRGADDRRIAFVRLPHNVDLTNVRVIRTALAGAVADNPSVVIADATETAFCDCAGVSALIRAHLRARAAGGQLRVVAPGARVQRIIAITEADAVLDVYLTIDDALADLTRLTGAPE